MSTSKAPPTAGSRVTCWPIHRIIAAGSVRCRKTSSIGAGRSSSVANDSVAPVLSGISGIAGGLQRCFEPAEVMRPEVRQELLHGGKAAGVDQEQMTRALAALVDQAGLVQDLQVPGHRLGGDVEVAGDVTDRAGIVRDELHDGPAVWFGQRLEGRVRVHGRRPRNATSRSVSGAPAVAGTAGPMRGAREPGVMACSAKASTCAARLSSSVAGWPVALARSQPWTRMSKVVKPARAGPGMSPSGVVCTRLRVSPAPAAVSAAAEASAYEAAGSWPAKSVPGRPPGAIGWRGARSLSRASLSHRVPMMWLSKSRTSHSVHGVGAPAWSMRTVLTIPAVEATARSKAS